MFALICTVASRICSEYRVFVFRKTVGIVANLLYDESAQKRCKAIRSDICRLQTADCRLTLNHNY